MTDEPKKSKKKVEEILKSADAGRWRKTLNITPEQKRKKRNSTEHK